MKKLTTIVMMLTAMAVMTGCLTNAGAKTRTKTTTLTDGTVIEERESEVSVLGTGDKVSQIAADGMFADGTSEDLGAGVKKASASQQSTGIGETLTGLGSIMKGMAEYAAATQGVRVPRAGAPVVDSAEVEIAPAEEAAVVYSSSGYGGAPGAGGAGVYGKPSCSRCRAYRAAHPGVELINTEDAGNKAAMFKALQDRGFEGLSVGLPVLIGATTFTLSAK